MTAWGVVGAGDYAIAHILPAINRSAPIVAIASRTAERSRSVGRELGLDLAPRSYAEVLEDEQATHVYVGAPTSVHRSLTEAALRAGKVVLCEKPFSLDESDANDILAVPGATERLLVGWMYQHHPRWVRVRQLIAAGAIGTPHSLFFQYSYLDDRTNLNRQSVALGGGSLPLVGCYGVHMAQTIFRGRILRAQSVRSPSDPTTVDSRFSSLIQFETGIAHLESDLDAEAGQILLVFGTEGRLVVDTPVNASPAARTSIELYSGTDVTTEYFEPADQFFLQAEHCKSFPLTTAESLRRDTIEHAECLARLDASWRG